MLEAAELSVDATISTPLGTKPLSLGADYVVHSLTKYIGGHGDALGGAVIGRQERIAALRKGSLIHLGGLLSPFAAWLILRGMETLAPRMMMHEANARRVEAFLADHPKVRSVFWPGSPRHPQHELADARCATSPACWLSRPRRRAEHWRASSPSGCGSSRMRSRSARPRACCSTFQQRTSCDPLSTWRGRGARSYRDWAADGVFRLSVGLEDPDDIIADLEQALG